MTKSKILVQLDTDTHPSVFDGVVAVDAGVEHLMQYGSVAQHQVRDLVHGAMFTRGPDDLRSTAIFVGGSDVATGEAVLKTIVESFFGPIRVSVMMDASGANTTAAGAVLAAGRHLALNESSATVLAATGPVGQRVTRLLAAAGCRVRVASRSLDRATELVNRVQEVIDGANLSPVATGDTGELSSALQGSELVIAAGAAGIELVSGEVLASMSGARVLIDLNAVPPAGIAGVDVMDKARDRHGVVCYGAIGVGGTKMKIHKAAITRLFERNDLVLDVEEIYQLGLELEAGNRP